LTFLYPASKLKDRIYVRVVSDIEIEYDNKPLESRWRTVIFYMTTGQPGRKLCEQVKLRGSRLGARVSVHGLNQHCANWLSDAPLSSVGFTVSNGRAAPFSFEWPLVAVLGLKFTLSQKGNIK